MVLNLCCYVDHTGTEIRRRLECHNCSTPRPANPRRVAADMDSPSNILKLSNLDPIVTCAAAAPAESTLDSKAVCCSVRVATQSGRRLPLGGSLML